MIQASIYGRLGKDAQSIPTKTGNPMAAASVAIDVSPKDGESTVWVRVVAFGRMAEALSKSAKGETLAASGRMELQKWTGTDGIEREQWQMVADFVHSTRTVRPSGGNGAAKGGDGKPRPRSAAADKGGAPFNDDIPF